MVTARAGNVIGGGDWAEDRLVPDIMRALENNQRVVIRNPMAVRPWQHVLEPLSGYLLFGQHLLQQKTLACHTLNFGPSPDANVNVKQLLELISGIIPELDFEIKPDPNAPHEAGLLSVDSSAARKVLDWQPVWDTENAIANTIKWYHRFIKNGSVHTVDDILNYTATAAEKKIAWAVS